MAVSSNQKIGELARIAYLALLHAEGELGDAESTLDGDTWSDRLRGIRSEILTMFSDTDDKVDLDKAIYLIGNAGSLVAHYHGDETDDADERLTKIGQRRFARHWRAILAPGLELARQHRHQRVVTKLVVIVQILVAERNAEHALPDERGD